MVTNYQLSHMRSDRDLNSNLRAGRRVCYHCVITTPISPSRVLAPKVKVFNTLDGTHKNSNQSLLTHYSWLQIHKHSPGHVLASTGLTEEGVEGVVTTSNGLVTGHLAIRLDSMLQTVQFPAGVSDLDTSLSNVDRDTFTLE